MTEERWRAMTYWPLVIASLLFIVAYSWQIIANLRGPASALAQVIMITTWVVFAADYLIRLTLATQKGIWFRSHLFDLLVVILPALKPLRLIKAITEVQRKVSKGQALRTRIALYAGGTIIVLIWTCSLAVLEAERNAPGATITSFGNAIWWALVTITTVGYGDVVPITVPGRVIAVALMAAGIGIVGVVTATTASWIVEMAAEGNDDAEAATRGQVRRLAQQITDLAADLAQPVSSVASSDAEDATPSHSPPPAASP